MENGYVDWKKDKNSVKDLCYWVESFMGFVSRETFMMMPDMRTKIISCSIFSWRFSEIAHIISEMTSADSLCVSVMKIKQNII